LPRDEQGTPPRPLPRAAGWEALLQRMLTELAGGEARAEAYWAQQLAFGPVLPYALALRLRDPEWPSLPGSRDLLCRVVELALAALGALPEGAAGAGRAALGRLAHRQVAALSVGRRSMLARLARKLGSAIPCPPPPTHPPSPGAAAAPLSTARMASGARSTPPGRAAAAALRQVSSPVTAKPPSCSP